ncbi:MAG TPA: hypothetical protein VLB84_10655 [Bacteroidia bacterium]|jgi:hypothetical protein|nr:hypothetical protein [Bacteroidia bacterium]
MKKRHSYLCCVLILLLALPSFVNAQCNTFVKKKCMYKIVPFTSNGQVNSSTLEAGKTISLNLSFSAGQDYRIIVCSEEILGEVTFKIIDRSKKVVFDSALNNFPDFWDFKAKSTQPLTVEVTAPPSQSTSSILPSGCLSILVGFK